MLALDEAHMLSYAFNFLVDVAGQAEELKHFLSMIRVTVGALPSWTGLAFAA